MSNFQHTIIMAPDEANSIADIADTGGIGNAPATEIIAGPYTHEYPTGYTIEVTVINRSPLMVRALLKNPAEQIVDRVEDEGRDIIRDYDLSHYDNTYTLSIVRQASREPNDSAVLNFVETGGKRCIFCGSEEMHSSLGPVENGAAVFTINCFSCMGTWQAKYKLTEIDNDTWTAPTENLANPD